MVGPLPRTNAYLHAFFSRVLRDPGLLLVDPFGVIPYVLCIVLRAGFA
jgi:hypothetical protein